MAVTDKTKGKKGISAFVVDRGTRGFRPGKKEDKLGVRSSDTSELILEDCRIPAGNLLGQPGMGYVDTLRILDRGRIGIAAFSIGIAQGAFEAALTYAKGRKQFDQAIAEFQAVQFKLSEMAMKIDASRLLMLRAARPARRRVEHKTESAMAKLFASEMAVQVALEAIQIHGGYGYVKDYPVERALRDSKLGTIGEGTSEVQKLVIARELLARGGWCGRPARSSRPNDGRSLEGSGSRRAGKLSRSARSGPCSSSWGPGRSWAGSGSGPRAWSPTGWDGARPTPRRSR